MKDCHTNNPKLFVPGYFVLSQEGLGSIYSKGTLLSGKLTRTSPQCKVQFAYYSNDTYAGVYAGFYQDVGRKSQYSQIFWKNVQTPSWQTAVIGIGARPDGKSSFPRMNQSNLVQYSTKPFKETFLCKEFHIKLSRTPFTLFNQFSIKTFTSQH